MESGNKGMPEKRRLGADTSGKWIRYSGAAMQMLGTILAFTYAGYWLDGRMGNKIPIWTLVLSLISIAASLYMLIRSFTRK